jgi:predicted ATP-binding protein involved in virulence
MHSESLSSPSFWLQRCSLENFRRFPEIDLKFERDATVLVGSNAGGKTAFLDALAIVLSAYVGAFDTGRGIGFQRTDAHVRSVGRAQTQEQQFPVAAEVLLSINNEPSRARRELRGAASRTTWGDAHELRNLAKTLQAEVRAGSDVVLPVIAYYGTGRMWRKLPKGGRVSRSRLAGYTDCLESAPTYRGLATWMRWAYLTDLQSSQRSEPTGPLPQAVLGNLAAVASRVLRIESEEVEQTIECTDVRYDFEEDAVVADLRLADERPVKLPVSSLSDGIRGVLGVAVDLALRAAILNPHLGSDAHGITPGIVLIDEVDLHLHPRWQQQVLLQLRDAFPNLQFVVTTHSPQVLSTVEGRSIRQLDLASVPGGRPGERQYAYTRGHESGEILRRVQAVPERPPNVEETHILKEYLARIDAGEGDSAKAATLRRKLDEWMGGPEHEPALLRADNALRVARRRRR